MGLDVEFFYPSPLHDVLIETHSYGPGGAEGPASNISPPKFTDNMDRLVWRVSIDDSSENALACAEGGDNKETCMEECLGLKLYR